MSWVDDNKGAGPWDFTERGDVWGYLNNPRWTDEPEAPVDYTGREDEEPQIWTPGGSGRLDFDSSDHKPCGHWHKAVPALPGAVGANIYGLFSANDRIWAVHFDGKRLTYEGRYIPPSGHLSGLVLYQDELLTVAGVGASASLRQINTQPVNNILNLIQETYPFNQYDFVTVNVNNLSYGAGGIFFTSPDDERIVRIDENLIKQARGCVGTVVNGTDGHLYTAFGAYASWADPGNRRPITGPYWSAYWKLIEDDLCDSPVVDWGVGTCYPANAARLNHQYYNGSLYLSYHASPQSRLRKINPVSLEIEAETDTWYGYRFIIEGSTIYMQHGLTDCTIKSYNTSDLALGNTLVLPDGRLGDIEYMGGYLIVITNPYATGDAGIYKIDPSSLTIVDSLVLGNTSSYQKLCKIDNQYIVAGRNTGVSVFSIDPLLLVADLDLSQYSDLQYSYLTQDIVVKI
jgi:hypothetical protein